MSHKVIYDVIHGNIEVSGFESILLKNPILNRLHQVLQNSTAYNVFPNLKASRFEHSLGSMNNAGKMYNYGIINSNLSNKFLKDKKELLVELVRSNYDQIFNKLTAKGIKVAPYQKYLQDNLELKKDWSNLEQVINSKKLNRFVLQFIGKDFCERNISNHSNINILLYQSTRLFGVLHDIGHLPLSHLFEYSIESVYDQLSDIPDDNLNSAQLGYISKLEELLTVPDDNYTNNKEQIHEKIGKNATKFIFQDTRYRVDENDLIDKPTRAVFIFIIFMLELIWDELIKGKSGRLYSIYSIVSSTVDADRLDYVQRDGSLSGIAKASGNFNRIIEMFCLGAKPDKDPALDNFMFMPSIQSLSDVEELLHQRFRIYRYMVNHHAVARSNYIFQKVIQNQILNEIKNDKKEPSDIYALEIGKLSSVIDIAVELSLKKESIGEFYNTVIKFIQLTDFWLLSTLNKEFIKTCEIEEDEHSFEQRLLKEVYEHRKNFRSLWKRNHEYHDFLLELGKKAITTIDVKLLNETKLSQTIFLKRFIYDFTKLNEILPEYENLSNTIFELEEELSTKKIIDDQAVRKNEMLKEYKDELLKTNLKLISFGSRIVSLATIYKEEINWVKKFENEFLNNKIHTLIKPAHLKTGIDNFYLIDKKNQDIIHKFDRFSLKNKSLNMEVENSIGFFVFYNINDNISIEEIIELLTSLFIDNMKIILTL